MKVITAIEDYVVKPDDIKVFMAGGITKCRDWQKEMIDILNQYSLPEVFDNVVLFNPRRENFPIHDPNASFDQIKWEFNWIEKCDFFLMHFCNSESVQPICMYELGRNIVRMQQKFPNDYYHRIMVCIESGYSREQDVIIQTRLAFKSISNDILKTGKKDYTFDLVHKINKFFTPMMKRSDVSKLIDEVIGNNA
jgi:hypothetical protein